MTWRLAYSIADLRTLIDELAPARSTASDGTIGDEAHSSRVSDHNPDDYGRVCAIDITHDPAGGCDAYKLAERLRVLGAMGDCRVKYVISNGRIASAKGKWAWRSYDGTPHDRHTHLSVTQTCADLRVPWLISAQDLGQPPEPPPTPTPNTPSKGDDPMVLQAPNGSYWLLHGGHLVSLDAGSALNAKAGGMPLWKVATSAAWTGIARTYPVVPA
jgi:hypothetical protein